MNGYLLLNVYLWITGSLDLGLYSRLKYSKNHSLKLCLKLILLFLRMDEQITK